MSDTATISTSIRNSPAGGADLSASITTPAAAPQAMQSGSASSVAYSASSITAVSTERNSFAQSWVAGLSQADQPFAMAVLALLDLLFGNREEDRQRQGISALAGLLLQAGLGRSSRPATYLSTSVSQVSQQMTSVQASAVQAVSYSQSSGGLPTTPASGQNINTVA